MFSLQMYRKFSTTSCLFLRRLAKHKNPGLDYQIAEIEDAAEVIKSDPEGFEGLESDLINAHKSYKQHELNLQHQREKIKQYIVKNKYFRKDPLPNLLTYAEKEQIKFLHSSDKEEWTIEKLAESFPSNVETIRKILKAQWTPKSSKRILSHDASVLRNWERFKNGEYNEKISTELYEHLKKFVDRETKDLNILQDATHTFQRKQWQKPQSNEFSSIILSLRPKNNITNKDAITDGTPKQKIKEVTTDLSKSDDSYLLGEIKNKKHMTIYELKGNPLLENTDNSAKINSINSPEKLNNTCETEIVRDRNNCNTSNANAFDYTEKFISNEVVISEMDRMRYEMSAIKERIHIPRKLWRKGATYRANDCYYDDDGEFLYRVPGMTAQ